MGTNFASAPTETNQAGTVAVMRHVNHRNPSRKILRWFSFGSAVINSLSAGSIMLYSLYAPIFQEQLGYSQTQINAVSIAGELGVYLPIPLFGYICDQFSPSHLSLLSSVFSGPPYLLAAVAFTNKLPYQFMVVAFAFIGSGSSSMNLASMVTCAKNFPRSRGLALAFPIASFGMSSLWQAQFVSRVFMQDGVLDVRGMFLFFAGMLFVVGVLGGVGLRVLADEGAVHEENEEETGLLENSVSAYGAVAEEEESIRREMNEKRWLNTATREFLKDRTMWLFALGLLLITGPGESFINNMGSLIHSLYPPTSTKNPINPATHVSLVSLTSTVARLLAGSLSDYLAPPVPTTAITPPPRRFTWSRMYLLFFFSLLMLFAQVFVASGALEQHSERFWIVSCSIGSAYGAIFCLQPIVVSVIWGTENFGTNLGITGMTPALGAAVFGLVWARWYDGNAGSDGVCLGKVCYEGSFTVMAGSVCLALLGWGWAWRGSGGWKERGVAV